MKLLVIPPYRAPGINFDPEHGGHHLVKEILGMMRKKGMLAGIDVDIDEGGFTEYQGERRDEEIYTAIASGFLGRVQDITAKGHNYDGVVSSGGIDPSFWGSRIAIGNVPLVYSQHASLHVASLIGDRTTVLHFNDGQAFNIRKWSDIYGFKDKLISVYPAGRTSPDVMRLIRKYKKEDRLSSPEVMELINVLTANCQRAIEVDRVDSIILGPPHFQCYEDEIRYELDRMGYQEIPLIPALPSAVEMCLALIHMKLTQSPRANPHEDLVLKPLYR